MALTKKPFRLYKDRDEDLKAIKYPIHLNIEDLKELESIAELMQEEKLGTVIKNLVAIGITSLKNDPVVRLAWETAFKKRANNQRLGILDANTNFSQKYKKE